MIYDNEDSFWTSDDEASDDESIAQDEDNISSEKDSRYGVDVGLNESFEEKLELIHNLNEFTNTKGLFNDTPKEIPFPAIEAPKENMIRKYWVISKETPLSKFEEIEDELAMTFPFELDPFQKRAIYHIHKSNNVFVAAHTSAGKTAIAEYAIAAAAAKGKRAIYTSPIKALSNQKFREFKNKFESVGIVTGDISLNPQAQCIIMTTEIFKNIIQANHSSLRQIDTVVFDEIHYLNDKRRGVVWEETIILLPREITLVMLSATVSNYLELADWVGRTKEREVFAIATYRRPVPLKHFLWYNNKAFLLLDDKKYCSDAYMNLYRFKRAEESHKDTQPNKNTKKGSSKAQQMSNACKLKSNFVSTSSAKKKTEVYRLQQLIRYLEQDSKLPLVVFCFSRQRCESLPASMSKLDLLTSSESKSKIHTFLKNSFMSLTEVDRNLPQIRMVQSFLERGIGVHHGGLLPILKEVVEILFSKGLIYVLFATETFAMGVNMPARCVIFTSVTKHTDNKNRYLLPSEYVQMAGRAGRRGLDVHGYIYIMCSADEPPDQNEIAKMMSEKAPPLESSFRLTFEMLLRIASNREAKIEKLLSSSYQEYARAQQFPTLKRDLNRITKEIEKIPKLICSCGDEIQILSYVKANTQLSNLNARFNWALWFHCFSLESNKKFSKDNPFKPKQIVLIQAKNVANTNLYGVIVQVEKYPTEADEQPYFKILVLLPQKSEWRVNDMLSPSQLDKLAQYIDRSYSIDATSADSFIQILHKGPLDNSYAFRPGIAHSYAVLSNVPLSAIVLVTDTQLSVEEDLLQNSSESSYCTVAMALLTYVSETQNILNPLVLKTSTKSLKLEFFETLLKQDELIKKINQSPCNMCYCREDHSSVAKHRTLCEKIQTQIKYLLCHESLHLYEDMQNKYAFLENYGFCESNRNLTFKGLLASVLTCSDGLTLTEVVFQNIFKRLTPSEAAVVLAAFTYTEKTIKSEFNVSVNLMETIDLIENIHSDFEASFKKFNISYVHEDWWIFCNFSYSSIVYNWTEGKSLADILMTTDVQEGTIVRIILNVDQLAREISQVAKTLLHNEELENLMLEVSRRIRRDIVFTTSLYFT